jgi:hypothetical protein
MIRTVNARIGLLATVVKQRNGRWRASLVGGHPSLGGVDSAIGDTAEGALLNLTTTVDAVLGFAPGPRPA